MAKFDNKAFEAAFQPLVEYSKLAAATAEQALNIQAESVKVCTEMGKENLTDLFKVASYDDMTQYIEKQKEVFKKASDLFVADTKALTELSAKRLDK